MTLRLVYRLYGGENLKGRPGFYSKRTSLASFARAAVAADTELDVLADGPLPDDLRTLASRFGRVHDLPGGPVGMRRSFLAALGAPDRFGWDDDDIVYFCEDDYLHHPDALVRLRDAAAAIPGADYFALYASTPAHPAVPPGVEYALPEDWAPHPDARVDGVTWINVPSTTSTFGARVGALRADMGIIRQGMIPYKTRLLDHEMCLVYQGRFPYTAAEVFIGPEETRSRSGLALAAESLVLTPFRLAYQLRALTRRRSPHPLYAPELNLASHMESDLLAPGTDWAAIAAAADAWSASLSDTTG
ncbi:MAG: hypothetical protein ABWY55_00325 [Microbacterium sp.]